MYQSVSVEARGALGWCWSFRRECWETCENSQGFLYTTLCMTTVIGEDTHVQHPTVTTARKQQAVSLFHFQFVLSFSSFYFLCVLRCGTAAWNWDTFILFIYVCLPLSLIIFLRAHLLFLTSETWGALCSVLFYSLLIIPSPPSVPFSPLPQWTSGSWSRR